MAAVLLVGAASPDDSLRVVACLLLPGAAMQNDVRACLELLGAGDDEYKKQLALLLEKRQHLRETTPLHPGDDPAQPLPPAVRSTVHKRGVAASHSAVNTNAHDGVELPTADARVDARADQPPDVAPAPDAETPGNNTVQPRTGEDAPVQGKVSIEKSPDSSAVNVQDSVVAESVQSIATQPMRVATPSYALVVVSCSFRHLPILAEKTKDVAASLFHALVDASFSRFARRGSRLLVNPSVIEFQDTMAELERICERDSSFVLCLSVRRLHTLAL